MRSAVSVESSSLTILGPGKLGVICWSCRWMRGVWLGGQPIMACELTGEAVDPKQRACNDWEPASPEQMITRRPK